MHTQKKQRMDYQYLNKRSQSALRRNVVQNRDQTELNNKRFLYEYSSERLAAGPPSSGAPHPIYQYLSCKWEAQHSPRLGLCLKQSMKAAAKRPRRLCWQIKNSLPEVPLKAPSISQPPAPAFTCNLAVKNKHGEKKCRQLLIVKVSRTGRAVRSQFSFTLTVWLSFIN